MFLRVQSIFRQLQAYFHFTFSEQNINLNMLILA